MLYYVFAMAAPVVGAFTTHGLGGKLKHGGKRLGSSGGEGRLASAADAATAAVYGDGGKGDLLPSPSLHSGLSGLSGGVGLDGEDAAAEEGWHFYQPFRGGPVFVATQAAAWVLFGAALVCLAWGLAALGRGAAICVRCWAEFAGGFMFVAQLLLIVSLFTFQV